MTPENRYAVDITVESRYVEEQSAPMDGVFAFAYTITITNRGTVGTQLISFQYTSGRQLHTPGGTMQGSYFFVAEDGARFDAEIPSFPLNMSRTLH